MSSLKIHFGSGKKSLVLLFMFLLFYTTDFKCQIISPILLDFIGVFHILIILIYSFKTFKEGIKNSVFFFKISFICY